MSSQTLSASGSNSQIDSSGGTVDITESMSLNIEGEDCVENSWGKLFPLDKCLTNVDLGKTCYIFGREITCDYVFPYNFPNKQVLSKQHFKLTRYSSNEEYTELEDLSRNGTYVNGKKVGNSNKQILKNNDEIGIVNCNIKAFHYVDVNNKDDDNVEKEVLDRFVVFKTLGSGASCEVRLAFEKGTANKYAIKIIPKNLYQLAVSDSPDSIMNEVNLLKKLKHPCIIKIVDVINTEKTLYIILELLEGGELFDRIESNGKLSESESKKIFYQLLLAIQYLHNEGITHRDLKPENILLSKANNEGLIKVTDFGISKFVDENTKLKTVIGTPNYWAPEVVSNSSGSYTNAVDCWSLGVVLHCCLVGYQPFNDDSTPESLERQIVAGKVTFPKQFWNNISKEAQDLVKNLLKVKPEERLTVSQALSHSWLNDEVMRETVHTMMEMDSENETSMHSGNTRESMKRLLEDDEMNGISKSSKKM